MCGFWLACLQFICCSILTYSIYTSVQSNHLCSHSGSELHLQCRLLWNMGLGHKASLQKTVNTIYLFRDLLAKRLSMMTRRGQRSLKLERKMLTHIAGVTMPTVCARAGEVCWIHSAFTSPSIFAGPGMTRALPYKKQQVSSEFLWPPKFRKDTCLSRPLGANLTSYRRNHFWLVENARGHSTWEIRPTSLSLSLSLWTTTMPHIKMMRKKKIFHTKEIVFVMLKKLAPTFLSGSLSKQTGEWTTRQLREVWITEKKFFDFTQKMNHWKTRWTLKMEVSSTEIILDVDGAQLVDSNQTC